MLKLVIIAIIVSLFFSCGPSKEEIEAQKQQFADSVMAAESAKKEEQRLQDSIAKAKQAAIRYTNMDLIGEWVVKMKTTKNSCDKSEENVVKAEKWIINTGQNNVIIVKVLGNTNTDGTYQGIFNGKKLILENHRYTKEQGFFSSKVKKVGSAHIELIMNSKKQLTGVREVLNPGPCQIEYDLTLTK